MATKQAKFMPHGIAKRVVNAVASALRSIATHNASVESATKRATSANKPHLVVLTTEMAKYDLAQFARVKSVDKKERESALRKIRSTFNASVLAPLGSNADSSKSLLTAYHRPITHPATTEEWGRGWAKGLLGATVKVPGGKSYELSLEEGRKRCSEYDRGKKTPLEQASAYIVRLSKKAKNPRAFVQGVVSICEQILRDSDTPAVKSGNARKVKASK